MQICDVRHNVADPESCGRAGKPSHRKDSVYFNYIFLTSPFPNPPWPTIWVTLNFGVMSRMSSGFTINYNVFHGNIITDVKERKNMLPRCRDCRILDAVAPFPNSLINLSSCLQQQSQSGKPQETETSPHHVPVFQLKSVSVLIRLSRLDNYWT